MPVLPNAEITIFTGATSESLAADESGRFSFELLDPLPDLVRIQACGVSDQSHICYTRLVHTMAHIIDNADGSDVFKTGPISPLSTIAYASLVQFGLNGQEPQTWNDIAHLVRGYQTWHLLNHGAALFELTDSPDDIPAGFANLLDLALDPTAMTEISNALDAERRATIIEGLISKPWLFLVPEAEFPVDSAILAGINKGSTVVSMHSLQLNPDQTGSLSTDFGSGTVDWENMADGDLIFADDMDFLDR